MVTVSNSTAFRLKFSSVRIVPETDTFCPVISALDAVTLELANNSTSSFDDVALRTATKTESLNFTVSLAVQTIVLSLASIFPKEIPPCSAIIAKLVKAVIVSVLSKLCPWNFPAKTKDSSKIKPDSCKTKVSSSLSPSWIFPLPAALKVLAVNPVEKVFSVVFWSTLTLPKKLSVAQTISPFSESFPPKMSSLSLWI